MKPPDEARPSYQAWMDYADKDFQVADVLLPQNFPAAVCFHAQQAAEKALKAYLAWLGEEDIPRTHSLLSLSALIEQRGGKQPPQDGLRTLNQHAVASRYPEEVPPTDDEAADALRFSQQLLDSVRQAVGPGENSSTSSTRKDRTSQT